MKPAESEYILDTQEESERLEKQTLLPGYQVQDEFAGFPYPQSGRVLDAGCGTGIVARHLSEQAASVAIEACDFSAMRLGDARRLCRNTAHKRIRFFESTLDKIEASDESYDAVTCRYVFEHLSQPKAVASEFSRILKKNGFVWIVDFDGLIFNLFPMSFPLSQMMDRLKQSLPVDLFVGRKIPALLKEAGFREIRWKVESVVPSGAALEGERVLMKERFEASFPVLSRLLGSDKAAKEFSLRYCDEMMRPATVLFCNKFIVFGRK